MYSTVPALVPGAPCQQRCDGRLQDYGGCLCCLSAPSPSRLFLDQQLPWINSSTPPGRRTGQFLRERERVAELGGTGSERILAYSTVDAAEAAMRCAASYRQVRIAIDCHS